MRIKVLQALHQAEIVKPTAVAPATPEPVTPPSVDADAQAKALQADASTKLPPATPPAVSEFAGQSTGGE